MIPCGYRVYRIQHIPECPQCYTPRRRKELQARTASVLNEPESYMLRCTRILEKYMVETGRQERDMENNSERTQAANVYRIDRQ